MKIQIDVFKSISSQRCTERTLESIFNFFKINKKLAPNSIKTGADLLDTLKDVGVKIKFTHLGPQSISIKEAKRLFPKGVFYLSGNKHAMALIDGNLTDTADGTDSRKVGIFHLSM